MAQVLELVGLTKHFHEHAALDRLDLSIPEGEFFSLLGPSGCGKTTTLRLIAGFEEPTAGDVLLRGRLLNRLRPYERNVSTVFQNYALFPHLTARENIEFGLRHRSSIGAAGAAARVKAVMEMLHISSKAGSKPAQLSGGEKQRVALARSLVLEPEVLLLDEPLSALDPNLRKQVRTELKALQRRVGITFLFITHDQEEALSMSDRVVVMNHGRIEQVGTPLAVYEQPATPFVADFLGKVNVLRATSLGEGRYLVGRVELATHANGYAAGVAVRLYLRPEDRVLPDSGPVEQMANAMRGRVLGVDFLGTYCLAALDVEGFEGQKLLVYFSLNQALEMGVREGATIPFALRGERVRAFPSA